MSLEDLKYTREHEWVRINGPLLRFGITEYAQGALGDIVFVSLPEVGQAVTIGDPCGEVESTKSVSDVYSPAAGTVVAVNRELEVDPSTINTDPYGSGWLVDLEITATQEDLLSGSDYEALIRDL